MIPGKRLARPRDRYVCADLLRVRLSGSTLFVLGIIGY